VLGLLAKHDSHTHQNHYCQPLNRQVELWDGMYITLCPNAQRAFGLAWQKQTFPRVCDAGRELVMHWLNVLKWNGFGTWPGWFSGMSARTKEALPRTSTANGFFEPTLYLFLAAPNDVYWHHAEGARASL